MYRERSERKKKRKFSVLGIKKHRSAAVSGSASALYVPSKSRRQMAIEITSFDQKKNQKVLRTLR